MLIQSTMDELLKYNDLILRSQQVKSLSRAFNDDISTVSYVLHYILFLVDESILCFFFRCFIQFTLSHMIDASANNEDIVSGFNRLNSVGQLPIPTISADTNNNNNNNNDNTTTNVSNNDINTTENTEITSLTVFFTGWPLKKKKDLVQKLLILLSFGWTIMFVYQIIFCLNGEFGGNYYNLNGGLSKIIKDSTSLNGKFNEFSNSKYAFSNGSLFLNIIGELRLRSRLVKFLTIVLMDFLLISLQIIVLIINYIVGFGLINRISKSDDEDDGNNTIENREYDGRQGNVIIFKINLLEALRSIK